MAVFAYQAFDVGQRAQSGTITADTAALAREALRGRGLVVAGVRPLRPQGANPWSALRSGRWLRGGAREAALAELWRNLSVLLRAGIPLVEALDVCLRQQRGAIQPVLRQVRESVRSGQALATALATHGGWFDRLTLAVVEVGQRSGALAEALGQLAEYVGRRRAVVNRLTTALIYPAILCLVGTGVVLFLMTQVIPQLLVVLASAGRELPAPTRVLQALSDLVLVYWPALVLVCAALVGAFVLLRSNEWGKRWLERLALAIPVLGDLLRQAWISRISLMLATLLRSDVRFTEALRTVREGLTHRLFRDELGRMEQAIEAGAGIAEPLQHSRLIPPLVVQLLAVGQESGELPRMLDELRRTYEQQVQLAIGRFLAALEPALILTLAIVIGFVVFATLLPILETTRMVQ